MTNYKVSLLLLTVLVILISSGVFAGEISENKQKSVKVEKIAVNPNERQIAQPANSAARNQILGMKQFRGPNFYDQQGSSYGGGYGQDYMNGDYGQGYGNGGIGLGYNGYRIPYSIPCYVPDYTTGRGRTGANIGRPLYYDGYGPCIVYGPEGYGYRYRYGFGPNDSTTYPGLRQ